MSFLIIFSVGCQALEKKPDTLHADDENVKAFKKTDYEKENYVRVQDYTGEGFELRDSKKDNGEIAERHRDDIEKAVKKHFNENYRTEVKINNLVSVVDGVAVYVESFDKLSFYTFVIVPISLKNQTVHYDKIWSLEGDVERAIAGGLYAFAFEEEFNRLDKFLEEKTEQFPIVGITEEMVKYVEADGYTTPYYFLAPFGDVYDNIVEKYLENPAISKEEVRTFLENNRQELHKVNVAIQLYMKEEYTAPDKEILEQIASDIENMSGIPYGSYSIHLNDNYIDKKRGTGLKDNTIRRSNQNKIIKR